ncbi:MAG: hypothetical protein R2718_00240 [Solirubrobacterales bacterium]
MRARLKAEVVLPATIVLAAVALGVSEFMTAFELTPPGGDPLSDQLAGDRHGFAMLILAVFAVGALAFAVATGQRSWAWATAGFGIAALLIFLVVDLPDVNQIGDVEVADGFGLASAEAVPQPGFWLEAAAAIVLGLASIAYATQPSEQRRAPRRLFESRRGSRAKKAGTATRPADQKQ